MRFHQKFSLCQNPIVALVSRLFLDSCFFRTQTCSCFTQTPGINRMSRIDCRCPCAFDTCIVHSKLVQVFRKELLRYKLLCLTVILFSIRIIQGCSPCLVCYGASSPRSCKDSLFKKITRLPVPGPV